MKYIQLIVCASLTVFAVAKSQEAPEKVIYKWFDADGLVYYSHIKPLDVKEFTKLDAGGQKIEDFTKGFEEIDEIVGIVARPAIPKEEKKSEDKQKVKNKAPEQNDDSLTAKPKDDPKKDDDNSPEARKKKNCETARKNLSVLEGGEVYEKDDKGNLIRLGNDAVDSKLKNTRKDVDYFCTD